MPLRLFTPQWFFFSGESLLSIPGVRPRVCSHGSLSVHWIRCSLVIKELLSDRELVDREQVVVH